MYKSNIFTQKEEIFIYPPNKPFNLLSPSYNPRLKTKSYFDPNINNNFSKYRPLNLYSSCFSPFQNGKNLSVKNINSPDDKVSQNLLKKLSGNQKGTIGSPNTTNSDLLTAASLTSQQSNESFLSKNNNNNVYITSSFQPYNLDRNESNVGNRFNYSMIKPNMNFCNYTKCNNNIFINGNYSNINLNYIKGSQGFITQNQNNNMRYKLNNKDNITNYNSNNSSNSNSSNSCKKSSSNNSNKSNNKTKKGKLNNQKKKYFNKFNSSKENITNENTVILTLKIKVGKNDIRYFHLKKYDDLFISLEKFFDLNKISQSLIKPFVNQIFDALNKIFWIINNKIGIYDIKYLRSLYKVWIKNNETLPKKNKNKDNNSTISSSDSSDENKHKQMKSNSFHDTNNLSEDDKDEKQKTSKSI